MSRLRELVARRTGSDPRDCILCGKCSAACAEAEFLDLLPHQVMRLLVLGFDEEILASKAIWLYSGDFDPAARCPVGIDVPSVMREIRFAAHADRPRIRPGAPGMAHLSQLLASELRRRGRVSPLGVGLAHRLRTGSFFEEAVELAGVLKRGKTGFYRAGVRGMEEIEKIFDEFTDRRE